jgi:hypothetical protein
LFQRKHPAFRLVWLTIYSTDVFHITTVYG